MIFQLVIIFILGLCYSFTIAPDLTWAHFSADGGDLIAAAATGGVPHPGGYPLYLILARFFQFIPVGTLAFRTNLLSAVCTILAALFLYGFLIHQLSGRTHARFVSFFAALAYGLAPFVWGQALVTEVYALHGLMMIASVYFLSLDKPQIGEWTRGFIFGIAAANHLTSIMIFPLIALNFREGKFVSTRVFLIRCAGILSGLLLYLMLPLRASFDPPVNWGDASTVDGFVWLVSGQLYHDYFLSPTFADILQRMHAFAGLLLEQYTWLGVLLAIYGLFSLRSRHILIVTLWMGTTFLLYALLYGSTDSQVNLLPVWLIFAIWLGYGLQDVFKLIHNFSKIRLAAACLLSVILILRIPFVFPSVDVSDEPSAQDFVDQSLAEIPRDALVFVDGDEQIFSLWYAQFALKRRLDVVLVAEGLLPYRWYIDNLHRNYPHLEIPEREQLRAFDLVAANPERVVCYISADEPLLCLKADSESRNIINECHDIDTIYLHSKPLSFPYCGSLFQEEVN